MIPVSDPPSFWIWFTLPSGQVAISVGIVVSVALVAAPWRGSRVVVVVHASDSGRKRGASASFKKSNDDVPKVGG